MPHSLPEETNTAAKAGLLSFRAHGDRFPAG
jgi:hypothetical protein